MSTSRSKSAAPPPLKPLTETTAVALEELARWQASHPALTGLDHKTFVAKYPAAYCEQLAGSTKARGTLKDARAWLRRLHPAPGAKALGDTGVPAVTMALFVEWTRQLAVAVETMNQGASDDGGVQVEVVRAAANACYHDTKSKVEEAIGQNETWKKQLKEALDSKRHDELDADAARLLRLRDAAHGWLGGGGVELKHSLGIEGVTAEAVAACGKAAAALEAARAAASGAKDTGRDPPAVNRVEGYVLVLMQAVFRAVNDARDRKKTQLVLQPGAATRRVLTPNARAKKARAAAEGAPGADVGATDATPRAAKSPRAQRKTR